MCEAERLPAAHNEQGLLKLSQVRPEVVVLDSVSMASETVALQPPVNIAFGVTVHLLETNCSPFAFGCKLECIYDELHAVERGMACAHIDEFGEWNMRTVEQYQQWSSYVLAHLNALSGLVPHSILAEKQLFSLFLLEKSAL